jgi:hypothetical protein
MFNLARRKEQTSDAFKQEALIFEKTPEAQRVQNDTNALVGNMIDPDTLQLRMSAEDSYAQMVRSVKYWYYVEKFHPEYKDDIVPKAEEIAKAKAKDMRIHPEKYPLPAKEKGGGEGGGGGMPPPMGAGVGRTIKSFVLPNGIIMVKSGGKYSVNTGSETVEIEAASDNEALRAGSLKVIESKPQKK